MITDGTFFVAEHMIKKYIPRGIYFYYVCAGRATGKSYSCYDICRKVADGENLFFPDRAHEKDQKFMYVRCSAVESQAVATKEGNAFKEYNIGENTDIYAEYNTKTNSGIWYKKIEDDYKEVGYNVSLTTFSNLRGVSYADVSFILFDECVQQKRYKTRNMRLAKEFLNMLETISRNREVQGRNPIIVIMLSNPIDLGDALLSGLNFTPLLSKMMIEGKQRITVPERSLHIERLTNVPISEQKKKTSLYKFARGTGFVEESLSGDFVNNDTSIIKKPPLNEYLPLLTLEDTFTVYEHKTKNHFHISTSTMTAKNNLKVINMEKFRDIFYWKYKVAVIEGVVTYDNYQTKVMFEEMIRYKQPN